MYEWQKQIQIIVDEIDECIKRLESKMNTISKKCKPFVHEQNRSCTFSFGREKCVIVITKGEINLKENAY